MIGDGPVISDQRNPFLSFQIVKPGAERNSDGKQSSGAERKRSRDPCGEDPSVSFSVLKPTYPNSKVIHKSPFSYVSLSFI